MKQVCAHDIVKDVHDICAISCAFPEAPECRFSCNTGTSVIFPSFQIATSRVDRWWHKLSTSKANTRKCHVTPIIPSCEFFRASSNLVIKVIKHLNSQLVKRTILQPSDILLIYILHVQNIPTRVHTPVHHSALGRGLGIGNSCYGLLRDATEIENCCEDRFFMEGPL